MATSVIVAGARTPVGTLLGGLSSLSAVELGTIAVREALSRADVSGDEVNYTILGQVLTAGVGQLPARQAAVAAGIPMSVPATTVSKVCLSGIQAVIMADQFIRTGDLVTVVAGGQESMSQAPRMVAGSRTGAKYGPLTLADHMEVDGLTDPFDGSSMGELTEQGNESGSFTREEMDAYSAGSQQRAAAAWDAGIFDDEVVPVTITDRRGRETVVSRDEGIRPDTTPDELRSLRPAFRKDGVVTAGNSSTINDGACALVVMSKEEAEARGLTWLAEIGAPGMVAGPDTTLQLKPANAIAQACEREGISPADLDLVEINEAFAAVPLASARELGISLDKVNVNGGAVAIGHPIGMSGARLVLHLALELRRRGGGTGAAALCGGGGQGDALIIRVPEQ